MNKTWHKRHKMPVKATPAQRLAWHLKHQKHCGCRRIPKTLQPLLADRPVVMASEQQTPVTKPSKRKTLRLRGEYWYGDGPADVWAYFRRDLWHTDAPVNHWKHIFCYECNYTRFEVEFFYDTDPDDPDCSDNPDHAVRICPNCRAYSDIGDPEGMEELPYDAVAKCVCGKRVFEVIGITEPSGKHNPDSAWWFHLGLRCVACGCVGSYLSWTVRYNDWRDCFTYEF